ncbi:MAG: hypothetical protein ACUVTG_06340, partial [Candidatus Oleimicrobiaceae bacterium]
PYTPAEEVEEVVSRVRALSEQMGRNRLAFYPYFGQKLGLSELDRMLDLTIALHKEGLPDRDITGLLGGNLRELMGRIFPSTQPRMMRPF